MELENLKTAWKKYDRMLNESIKLNEKMLKNTFTHQANGIIENLLKWEYFSLIEFIIFLAFMGIATFKFMNDWKFLISGIFIITFLVSCIVSGIQEIRILNSIDLFSHSIIETKQTILRFKKRSNDGVKILIFIIPPIVLTFIVLGVNFIRNINLFDYPVFFAVLSSCIIILGYGIVFIFYRTFYLRKFKLIENNLSELELFISE